MKVSNCLIFAAVKWFKTGGYLVIRKSRNGPWPHFIHCSDLRDAAIEQYVPINPNMKLRYLYTTLFRGHITTSDRTNVR